MKTLSLLLALVFSLTVHAGFEGLSAGSSLDIFNKLDCSTGLTCTKVKDKFTMVASPTLAAAPVSFTAAAITDAVLSLISNNGAANGDTWKIKALATGNALSFYNNVSGADVLKFSISSGGNISTVGNVIGTGANQLYGFLNQQIAATAVTITAAQCGSSFINTGIVTINLPEASTVLGCRITFITGNAAAFDVNPDNADVILATATNVAGDAISNATLGNSITLEAISAVNWAPVAVFGTYTDIN